MLGELDKQLLREGPARLHAALSLPLLVGLLDRLISRRSPLRISAKEHSRSSDGKTQEGNQHLSHNCCGVCVDVHKRAHTHIDIKTAHTFIHTTSADTDAFCQIRVSHLWNSCDWCVFAPLGVYICVLVCVYACHFLQRTTTICRKQGPLSMLAAQILR